MNDEKLSTIKEFISAWQEMQAALDDLEAAQDRYTRAFEQLTKATAAVLVKVMGKTLAGGGINGGEFDCADPDHVARSRAVHRPPLGAKQ